MYTTPLIAENWCMRGMNGADYPPTLPIDSTLPLPFVSSLTRSVSILYAEGLMCTI